LVVCIL